MLPAPRTQHGGAPRRIDMRAVLDTLLYQNRTGCQWDMLPHDLLPKSTVYDYFAQWRDDGTWAKIVGLLRTRVRIQEGREPTPSAACIDSQSVKTTEVGGSERGYDGGKKINGRKQQVLVDTLRFLLVVLITSAALDDGAAAVKLLAQISAEDFPRLSASLVIASITIMTWRRGSKRSAGMADGSEEAPRRNHWLCSAPQALGSGTDQRLAWARPPQQQRL